MKSNQRCQAICSRALGIGARSHSIGVEGMRVRPAFGMGRTLQLLAGSVDKRPGLGGAAARHADGFQLVEHVISIKRLCGRIRCPERC